MQRLGVGRTPLRDALRLLAHDGLVIIEPRRGSEIAPLTSADLHAIFDVRVSIEPLIAQAAVARAGERDLEAFGSLATRAAEGHSEVSDDDLDEELHRRLVDLSGNRFLVDIYQRLRDESLRFRYLTGSGMDSRHAQADFFKGVQESLADGDAERLTTLLVHHVQEFRDGVWQALSDKSGGWLGEPVGVVRF